MTSVLIAVALAASGSRPLGSLTFAPCTLSTEQSAGTSDALCTTLEVPEDRAHPEGRKISLAIAWIPSKAYEAAPDPVFLLAGGPGQSARDSYPQLASAFAETLRKRHVILVDQRGTGGSHALACKNPRPTDDPDDEREAMALAVAFTKACASTLDADPAFYSTAEALEDLDAVRAALGAEQLDLVGISYGTRVAQQYAKHFPARTRAIVLDGVVPNTLVLGSEHAKNLEASLDLQFARCTADPVCHQRFGSPRADLDGLLAKLRKAPMPVDYRDPVTGVLRHDTFGAGQLAGVVRLFAYLPPIAAVLPVALHEATEGHPEILMAQSKLISSVIGESITMGMQWSVMCTEDADELRPNPADEHSVLGNALIEVTVAQCAVWPHHARAAGFREPLATEVPALVLSGEFDPVTPPRYGDEVVARLPKGRHLIAKGQGHNVLPTTCLPRLMGEFFKKADAKGLDASCLESLTRPAPFTSLIGSEP
jgi:pimeloyl-ACP methyl ester carboxylesterase